MDYLTAQVVYSPRGITIGRIFGREDVRLPRYRAWWRHIRGLPLNLLESILAVVLVLCGGPAIITFFCLFIPFLRRHVHILATRGISSSATIIGKRQYGAGDTSGYLVRYSYAYNNRTYASMDHVSVSRDIYDESHVEIRHLHDSPKTSMTMYSMKHDKEFYDTPIFIVIVIMGVIWEFLCAYGLPYVFDENAHRSFPFGLGAFFAWALRSFSRHFFDLKVLQDSATRWAVGITFSFGIFLSNYYDYKRPCREVRL